MRGWEVREFGDMLSRCVCMELRVWLGRQRQRDQKSGLNWTLDALKSQIKKNWVLSHILPHSVKWGHLVFSSYEKCFNSKYIFLINPDIIMKKTSVFPFILFKSKSQFDFIFRSLFGPNVKNT